MTAQAVAHTPGPWTFNGYSSNRWHVGTAPDSESVANAFTEADARLIAAGPELLAALKDTIACLEEHSIVAHPGCINQLRAVVAKATAP